MHTIALLCLLAIAAQEPAAVLAWFTAADISGAIRVDRPQQPPREVPGSYGSGILPTDEVPVENPLLSREAGMLSFWIKPNWNGDDGRTHRLLRIGDPKRNGLLVEKAATGMLRYVMASPEKVTAARADVSKWRAGEWRHVAVAWFHNGKMPIGLPLWVDKVAVAGPIAGGNTFLDPAAMDDARVWLGGPDTDAIMDELIMRKNLEAEGDHGQVAIVYRDYFRTAPYTRIEIDPEPCRVPADRRVVAGHEKQFGLLCEAGGRLEPVTDNTVRYGQWAEFDAKPLIRWSTSDEKIATVDDNGRVTGRAVGACRLTAEFRGMRAEYALRVIPIERPDLDLPYVERLPRYRCDRAKCNPDPGETVTSVAHVFNYGYRPAPAGVVVRWEMLPDANRNFRLDPDERPARTQEVKLQFPLEPGQEIPVTFEWQWTTEPYWVRVTVDPDDKAPEICEANNQVCELNIGRPLRFGYDKAVLDKCYNEKRINHVGSFSYYDWFLAEKLRMDVMLREAVWPTTSPYGVRDAYRADNFIKLEHGEWEEEPWVKVEPWYDGGFPINEPVDFMAIDSAIIHEFGHTCLALPDLYGYPTFARGVLLKDENGNDYAGGPLMPILDKDGLLPRASSNTVPCGVGYVPLMDFCHLWLHPAQAGQVDYFAGYRGPRFWGTQGRLIPWRENFLLIYDVEDQPIEGAAVYVYGPTQTKCDDAGTKFFADRVKFMGHTDEDGRFKFPETTDEDWDDADSDQVDGAVAVWNPFGRAGTTTGSQWDTAFTPNAWTVEGLLLVKIVCGTDTEFYWLPMTEFNEQFFSGNRIAGVYPIRTSLRTPLRRTRLVRREIPEAIRERNLAPTAVVETTEITVKCGEEIVLDGSKSCDPEKQPLIYRWRRASGDISPTDGTEATFRAKAPDKPGEVEIQFYVIDGIRVSDPVTIKVNVVES